MYNDIYDDIELFDALGIDELAAYIDTVIGQKKTHKYYEKTVKLAEEMGVHIEGFKPYELLKKNRPHEPEDVREYRLSVWQSVTKSESEKVLNTINRIFNPKFLSVHYPKSPSLIDEENSLSNYFANHYGIYKSLWNFVRETLLKMTLSDANGACLVMPSNLNAEDTEYYEPIPYIYRSANLIHFKDDTFFTFWFPDDEKTKSQQGYMLLVDKERIKKIRVKSSKDKVVVFDFEHGLGVCPCFRLGGRVEGDKNPYYYTSFVYGIAPHWNKAISMISDMDGSIVNHLYPERWEWQTECNTCNGKGLVERIKDNSGETIKTQCVNCKGSGFISNRSPFGALVVKNSALNPDAPVPTPPADYITKDIEPIRELDKQIAAQILKGYSAINMDILNKVGENQSGVAKVIDRQDLESFLMRIANHTLDYQVRNIIEYTALYRYKDLMQNQLGELSDYIEGISINRPIEYNVLTLSMLTDELKEASATNTSGNYYRQIERDMINIKFSNNEQERLKNLAIVNLKPFPNKSIDQLMSANAMGAISKRDIIRNENIEDIVERATIEDKEFITLNYEEQLNKVYEIIDRDYMVDVPTIPVGNG